jgi:hypothetical protein
LERCVTSNGDAGGAELIEQLGGVLDRHAAPGGKRGGRDEPRRGTVLLLKELALADAAERQRTRQSFYPADGLRARLFGTGRPRGVPQLARELLHQVDMKPPRRAGAPSHAMLTDVLERVVSNQIPRGALHTLLSWSWESIYATSRRSGSAGYV